MNHLARGVAASILLSLAACGTAEAPPVGSPTVAVAGSRDGVLVRSHSGFASLPDRGRFSAPDATRQRRVSGDFTWDPLTLSEQHALNAIGGVLVFPTPEGKPLVLRYLRHEEHPDGNWTWVGRGADGEDAVITFGDEAVFGSVQQGKRTLRIATTGGGAWMVSTRPGAVVDAWREGGDVLLPPARKDLPAARGPSMAGAERLTAAVTALADPVVDIVVGFTTGFAADRGGESAARTRINNLVEITNQAYANSQLAARVRLVHAMSVNYADATANEAALKALTGSQGTLVDPALVPLRQARDQYGGDLVVLLRDFQTPQNDGCGIAWLVGGGGSTIDASSEGFGYSVVADGTDVDETDGKTYGCREETFAHELGHNMGQTHNREDSTTQGAHPYSYGYRHPAEDAFYTVMAYRIPGSTQFPIRYFANPAVGYQNAASAYNGAPTGVANESDNVASMRQTMPAVAQFRQSLVPTTPVSSRLMDLDGDGFADIFWRNEGLEQADWWYMRGAARVGVGSRGVGAQYRVAAIADFSGDGRSDILWEDGTTVWLWRAEAAGGFSVHFVDQYPAGGWSIAGAGDLNRDGKADIVWSNRTREQADWWYMDGAVRVGVGSKPVASQYRIAGIADFSGDGRADILWVDATSMWLWRSEASGAMTVLGIGAYPGGDWAIAGVGDFDGNGRADIFWNSKALSRSDWWYMDGAVRVGVAGAGVDARYSVAAIADYSGDGRADVLWQDGQTLWIWRAEATGGFSVHFVGQYPQGGWQIAR